MRAPSTQIKVRNWRIVAFVLAVLLGYSIVGHNDRRVAATCGGHLKYTSAREEHADGCPMPAASPLRSVQLAKE